MGGNNQQPPGDGDRSGAGSPPAGEWAPWRVESLVFDGARAAASGPAELVDAACSGLDDCVASRGWQPVTRTAGGLVCSVLASLWEGGWAPAEVVHQVRRHRRREHADLVLAALGAADTWELAGGCAMPPTWRRHLAQLGVTRPGGSGGDWLLYWLAEHAPLQHGAWPVVLEALGVALFLPPVEPILVPPSGWSRSWAEEGVADDAALAKIRALLAKAESTTFAAEADALSAKAQELMARHAIEEAVARAGRVPGPAGEAPVLRRVLLEDPYASAKTRLLEVVATANDVRCVWYQDLGMMATVGYAADLDAVEMLFTSLLVQATRAMLAEGRISDRHGRSRTRSFRQSFLLAFAVRIGERLAQASLVARHRAEQDMGASVLPVLAGRRREVDDAALERFPGLGRVAGPSVTNQAGWRAGRVAAEAATLDADRRPLERVSAGA